MVSFFYSFAQQKKAIKHNIKGKKAKCVDVETPGGLWRKSPLVQSSNHSVNGCAAIKCLNLSAFYFLTERILPWEQGAFHLWKYKIKEGLTAQSFLHLCNFYEKDSKTVWWTVSWSLIGVKGDTSNHKWKCTHMPGWVHAECKRWRLLPCCLFACAGQSSWDEIETRFSKRAENDHKITSNTYFSKVVAHTMQQLPFGFSDRALCSFLICHFPTPYAVTPT